ncbi:helicase C-terminal domain-containing protein [Blastocladiella britannica]|nr:helicase C-terminal domain-containing protein [Blastocladiella britannica]
MSGDTNRPFPPPAPSQPSPFQHLDLGPRSPCIPAPPPSRRPLPVPTSTNTAAKPRSLGTASTAWPTSSSASLTWYPIAPPAMGSPLVPTTRVNPINAAAARAYGQSAAAPPLPPPLPSPVPSSGSAKTRGSSAVGRGNVVKKSEKKPPSQVQSRLDFSKAAIKPKAEPKSDAFPEQQSAPEQPKGKMYTMSGVPVRFPFQAYPSQIQMMSKIITALNDGKHALLESPTGSGKSLAILCAALAWREHELPRRTAAHAAAEAQYVADMRTWAAQQNAMRRDFVKQAKAAASSPPVHLERTKRSIGDVIVIGGSGDEDNDDFLPGPVYAPGAAASSSAYGPGFPPPIPRAGALGATTGAPQPPANGAKSATLFEPPVRPTLRPVPRIYVASRTHKQLEQLVGELRSNSVYRPKMTVLASRTQYCINTQVIRAGGSRNEACSSAIDNKTCKSFDGARALKLAVSRGRAGAVWDVEDLKQLGIRQKGCPYFAARAASEEADLILCPYNYLIDPSIRSSMGIDLDNAVVIVDEAHNIEDVAREAATLEIDDLALDIWSRELTGTVEYFATKISEPERNELYGARGVPDYAVLLRILQAVESFIGVCSLAGWHETTFEQKLHVNPSSKFITHLTEHGITEMVLVSAHGILQSAAQTMQDRRENPNLITLSEPVFRGMGSLILALMNVINPRYVSDFHVAVMERVPRSRSSFGSRRGGGRSNKLLDALKPEWHHKLAIWCMNPGVIFSELASQAHSVILTSGTLSPMTSFASELGTEFPVRLEADHVIGLDQTLVGAVAAPLLTGTFQGSEQLAYQDAAGHVIAQLARIVPHGLLVFVPSYAFLDKLMTRWKATGCFAAMEAAKTLVLEPRGGQEGVFEQAMAGFSAAVEESARKEKELGMWTGGGAILFGVFRGKVSEGIDFSNERARAVVTLGVPYPNTKDKQVQLKKSYNNMFRTTRGLMSGSDWYDVQAFRALNQALGRCIRHRNDWGALVLLDCRLTTPKYQSGLSKWVRPRMVTWPSIDDALGGVAGFVQYRTDRSNAAAAAAAAAAATETM